MGSSVGATSSTRSGRTGPSGPSAGRALRADALRNRARLLEVADEVFAERGTQASLEEIARRAEVGIGTLYRHFPSRDDLVESLIHDRMEELLGLAAELAEAEDPYESLRRWLEALSTHAATYRGLAESLVSTRQASKSLAGMCEQQRSAVDRLLRRAQDAGLVRSDVTADEVRDLVSSVAWVTECGSHSDRARLLAIILDGLRAPS